MSVRDSYLLWTRRALPALLLPLFLTGIMQMTVASDTWSGGPQTPPGVRSLFVAVAVAAVIMGRSMRTRDTAARPLSREALAALSWRLLTLALIPAPVGAVLAFMTGSAIDYYFLLAVSLVGIALLFPRYDQWLEWSSPAEGTGA